MPLQRTTDLNLKKKKKKTEKEKSLLTTFMKKEYFPGAEEGKGKGLHTVKSFFKL